MTIVEVGGTLFGDGMCWVGLVGETSWTFVRGPDRELLE